MKNKLLKVLLGTVGFIWFLASGYLGYIFEHLGGSSMDGIIFYFSPIIIMILVVWRLLVKIEKLEAKLSAS